jgi:undecaprenyl-diphosphatase
MNNRKYIKPLVLFAATLVFSLLTYFVDRKPIGLEGTSVGFATINGFFRDLIGYRERMDIISDVVMYLCFVVVLIFAVYGAMQLIREKSLLKVNKVILGLGILYVAVAVIYVAFGKIPVNYRPIMAPGETELETSFPSTHVLVICSVLGSASIAADKLMSDFKKVETLVFCAYALMGFGVVARMLAGVHWLTDIIAGMLFSATLVSLYVAWSAD